MQQILPALAGCAIIGDMDIYNQLQEQEQAKLNAAGLAEVKFTVGWFKAGDHIRLEARLSGPPDLQKKARELLSFSGEDQLA